MPRMHGKSFADGSTLVNTEVHKDNVKAFELAGWEHGEHADAPEAADHDAKLEEAEKSEGKAKK